ncbi:helix-hairpin-helix domain-containing protein [Paenarthrobacter sp. NPDC092416]|uniref:helix-hairpin-helix domain-containing protein n=1 Tax=Paenarthrobacter sp. NPDC092416 TaxID=3364386 RepID=UPI0037F3C239
MPRWNRDAPAHAAAQAARQRFASRMAPDSGVSGLLPLPAPPEDEDEAFASPLELPVDAPSIPRLRWRSPRRVVLVIAAAACLMVGWQVWSFAAGTPTIEPLSPSTSASSSSPAEPPAGTPGRGDPETSEGPRGEGKLLVHVAGAVQKPGVVELPAGSRVFQAVEAAGGATPAADLNGLNLAEVVQDGAKIHVPVLGEPVAGGAVSEGPVGSGSSGATAGTGVGTPKVNINTASLEELGTLPRVGPVTAQRIVDWRKEHGPFASIDELDAIDGIGPKLMESLRNLVTV